MKILFLITLAAIVLIRLILAHADEIDAFSFPLYLLILPLAYVVLILCVMFYFPKSKVK